MSAAPLELRPILAELVAIDSVSSRSNVPMIDLLEPLAARLGFTTERVAAGVGKQNLVARRGPPGDGGLALVGHTDTVPYDAAWKEALTLTERAGNLYGRGACDTKGFIACALAAASRAPRALTAPLWLIFTSDEEVGCEGAKALLEHGRARPRHAIVGEPTQLQPVRGGKGYCLAEVRVVGAEGHSAYPDRGASALEGVRLLLDGLELLSDQLRQEGEVGFSPPYTTLNVGVLQSGKAKNIVPGEATFTLEWRPPPGQPTARVVDALQRIAAEVRRRKPRLKIEVNVGRTDLGFATPKGSPLVQFLEAQSGKASTTVPFGTEAPQLIGLGAEVVVFGPGDIRVAHQTGEHVPIADLARATDILVAAIERFAR